MVIITECYSSQLPPHPNKYMINLKFAVKGYENPSQYYPSGMRYEICKYTATAYMPVIFL
jgi:hypothetical protein